MAKLTKEVLKDIVKECLVEILSEGLMGKTSRSAKGSQDLQRKRKTAKKRQPASNPRFERKVQETARALTQDPMMAAIFEDTAKTTLQEQVRNESAPTVPHHDFVPDQGGEGSSEGSLFEGSSNWAALAFSEKKNI